MRDGASVRDRARPPVASSLIVTVVPEPALAAPKVGFGRFAGAVVDGAAGAAVVAAAAAGRETVALFLKSELFDLVNLGRESAGGVVVVAVATEAGPRGEGAAVVVAVVVEDPPRGE